MIEWNPIDILTCLEVEPTVDAEELSHRYAFSRDGLVVALEIWPYDSDVWLAVWLTDQLHPVVDLWMEGCQEIRYLRDGSSEQLHFRSYDQRSQHRANIVEGWRFLVRPNLQVKLGGPEAG